MKIFNELKENRVVIIIMLITIIAAGFFNQYLAKDYSRVNNDSTDFVSGKIVEITSSNLEYDQDLKINLGKCIIFFLKHILGVRKQAITFSCGGTVSLAINWRCYGFFIEEKRKFIV